MYNLWQYRPKRVILAPGTQRYRAKSEIVFVRDNGGTTEVEDATIVWANPDIYVWTHAYIVDNVMCYFFDFIEP